MFLYAAILCMLVTRAVSLRFYLKNGEQRCFSFDAEANSVQRGDARAEAAGSELHIRVIATGKEGAPPVYEGRLRSASKFSFRTPPHSHQHHDYDDYDDEDDEEDIAAPHAAFSACLTLSRGSGAVSFNIRSARSNADPADVAASDKGVKGVSLAMRQMHQTLSQLTSDLARLEQREHKLLDRNARVGSRVVTLALFSIVVLLASTAVQLTYFKSFFKQKKLL